MLPGRRWTEKIKEAAVFREEWNTPAFLMSWTSWALCADFTTPKFPSEVEKWEIKILIVFGVCDVTALLSLNWPFYSLKSQSQVNFNGTTGLQRAFHFPAERFRETRRETDSLSSSFAACCITVSHVRLFPNDSLLERSVSTRWAPRFCPGCVKSFSTWSQVASESMVDV